MPVLTCPHCGHGLQLAWSLKPEHAPYKCSECHHAWFRSELGPQAREAWDATKLAHVGEFVHELHGLRLSELQAQHRSGANFYMDELVHLDPAVIKALASNPAVPAALRNAAGNFDRGGNNNHTGG